ncbi:MAG: hypothetical protein H7837_04280 [Magnetococcus sp. MYC-9]
MLNSVSASAIYGLPDPLQVYASQQRVSSQIQTNNFEQVHVRSVAGASGPGGAPLLESADAAESGRIRESLRYTPDRPLYPTGTLESPSPEQVAAAFRRVQNWLTAADEARDPANRIKTISVYA